MRFHNLKKKSILIFKKIKIVAFFIQPVRPFYITVQLIVFPGLSLLAGLLLSTFEYLFIFFIAPLISPHSSTYFENLLTFLFEALILLYCLIFGRALYYYEDVYVYKVLTESMGGILRAYNVNKHLGILTPCLERRNF